ncbi:RHS repeat domain-containing protein [Oceanicoccus sagamiensis]|uniref:RHS protein conserved region domain-containing protein n=1 Tax=Oceanicoccus sagamiensis TaxID=716816 RepID=A0A1X9NH71_9GAMM|nr:RHS repeat-associated core domain-containing protein [Oceanicoccus sagamiensis]ARN75195.1 hypothetical protein BST96_14365 [Oceanicoccus sagamiensis]
MSKYLLALVALLLGVTAKAEIRTYHIHNDHLGTPIAVTDENQNIVWQANKKPFGETTETVGDIDQLARFFGQMFDEESGLHYNYYRDYDPTVGRYIQSDPIGLAGGLNTYTYAINNPLKYIDPFGLDIKVSMNSSGAMGFGHVGGGIAGEGGTQGFYPAFPSTVAPGAVKPDTNTDGEVVIPTDVEQDLKFKKCMQSRKSNPGIYAISSNNCTRLIQSCLGEAGVSGFNNSTLPKKFFCSIAKKYGCSGEGCDECDK